MKFLLRLSYFSLSLLFPLQVALAADTGVTDPQTTSNVSSGDGNVWDPHANAKQQDDVYAASALSVSEPASDYLRAGNFGFDLPGGAAVTGIKVEIDWYSVDTAVVTQVRLVKAGVPAGTDLGAFYARTLPASDTDTYDVYNDSTWGTSWSEADIENEYFGVQVQAENNISGDNTAYVDHIQMTVYYTDPAGSVPDISLVGFAALFLSAVYFVKKQNNLFEPVINDIGNT